MADGEDIEENRRTRRTDRLDYRQLSGQGRASAQMSQRSRNERSNHGQTRALPAIQENDTEGISLSSLHFAMLKISL